MHEFCVAKLLKALDVNVVAGKTSKRRIVTHEKPWSRIDTHLKPWLHMKGPNSLLPHHRALPEYLFSILVSLIDYRGFILKGVVIYQQL